MAPQEKTPGVYIQELNAFPNTIVGVPTAVPLFIGYTENAEVSGKSVFNTAVPIRSFAEFQAVFGGMAKPQFTIGKATKTDHDVSFADATGTERYFNVAQTDTPAPLLHTAMQLFYDNGGGECYVLSVGDFAGAARGIDVDALIAGLDIAGENPGPTLLVVPDATLLAKADDFARLTQATLKQCATLQDRFAILDVYGTQTLNAQSPTLAADVDTLLTSFRASLGAENLSYGASYFPFLATSCVDPGAIDYAAFDDTLSGVLKLQATAIYSEPKLVQVEERIALMALTTSPPDKVTQLNAALLAALPVLAELEKTVARKFGVLPPSAALAGVYSATDAAQGVWKAPANVALASVLAPTVPITDTMQETMNAPVDGKAVDAIRSFTGRGTVVWGARTLDGNSNDWRYVPVRRLAIFMEQSIKSTLETLVFESNDANCWAKAKSMVSDFLHGLWAEGGLNGSTPAQAYGVECGLGSTMTAQDILDGYMIVQVLVAPLRPAEFIVLTFKQQMSSG